MVTKIVMPKLSLTMKEGTVGKWYKKEGEVVEKGEPIVEIISEKATYDLESPASGVLRKILVEEGVDAPVNAALAFITSPDEAFSEEQIRAEAPQDAGEVGEKVLASPAAKRLAREHGINLSLVKGSGPEGRIVEEDVKRFLEESRGLLPKIRQVIPLSGFRKTSAERVSTSFKTAPHSTVVMEVDVSEAEELHNRLRVSYTTIIIKAVAKALIEHPLLNSTLDGNQIKVFEDVNLGVAAATEYGLVVPVIHNADKKSLQEIDAAIKGLTEKARQGKLSKEELTGGTFTITNLGMYDVEFFTPIINPPEAAILGVGKITEKPVVINGKVEVKPRMMLSLSYDHRIVDGAPASEFLRKIKEKIERASELES
ncbi:MAG: dihydrolipoamide acetyltransferase family protein [Candidatus Bathyarchaeota archaeon]|jgi:pyruvate dehydrogenase E2 component (dihydrolipoamide acetyltransferase)|nr:2-oxo acid dehydrogenase subunit E2 [Candidatus Bathyarchaeota archaeon A05DMB-5]MDH7557571.1 dihydrolipoamide acetyltransferase family protein [Candidatus Bathyarchaeota archaeon]